MARFLLFFQKNARFCKKSGHKQDLAWSCKILQDSNYLVLFQNSYCFNPTRIGVSFWMLLLVEISFTQYFTTNLIFELLQLPLSILTTLVNVYCLLCEEFAKDGLLSGSCSNPHRTSDQRSGCLYLLRASSSAALLSNVPLLKKSKQWWIYDKQVYTDKPERRFQNGSFSTSPKLSQVELSQTVFEQNFQINIFNHKISFFGVL